MGTLPLPRKPRNIGECIYCGTTEGQLTKEHAVPYALHGTWTLLNASCGSCAVITSRFEKNTLDLYGHIRTALKMRTRHPDKRLPTLPLVVDADRKKTIQVPVLEYPLYLPVPVFLPPGIKTGRPLTPGMSVLDLTLQHIAGPSYKEVQARHGYDFVGTRHSFSPELFAQTLAKIAYCAGIYMLGLAPMRNSPLRQIILSNNLCFGHWIGSWSGDVINAQQGPIAVKVLSSGATVEVVIRFFAQFNTPEYHVVLGTIDSEFVNSPEWPWK